jgi:hypothetical protein
MQGVYKLMTPDREECWALIMFAMPNKGLDAPLDLATQRPGLPGPEEHQGGDEPLCATLAYSRKEEFSMQRKRDSNN